MMIAPNSRALKGGREEGKETGEYGGIWGEEEENTDYGEMVQPSRNMCKRGWVGIGHERCENGGSVSEVEVTQKAGVVPRCIRAVIGTLF